MSTSALVAAPVAVRPAVAADAPAWDAFVASRPDAVAYHRWAWGEVIEGALRLPRTYLAAWSGSRIVGVLPLVRQSLRPGHVYFTSLPFVNYAGLLAEPAAVAPLLEAARALVESTGARYAELRSVPGTDPPLPSTRRKVRPVLELPQDPDVLFKAFGAKLRSQVKRPLNEGMVVDVGGAELLDDVYRILSIKWRQLGSPIYRRAFFERLLEALPGDSTLLRVRAGDVAVGAGWLHGWRDETEIVWAATLREYDRFSPNMLLYWTAMKTAIAEGRRRFDFGRSSEGAGTHRFKLQWGPQVQPLPWHYVLGRGATVPDAVDDDWKARAFRTVWTRLPLAVTQRFGQAFARRLPL